MNADLERQLAEMGGDYRAVVNRLRCAAEVELRTGRNTGSQTVAVTFERGRGRGWLVAAALALATGLGVVFLPHSPLVPRAPHAPAKFQTATEYRLAHLHSEAAIAEMIRTQRADGGWKTDFLTRQNAEALKLCDSRAARIAYKKAMRNLRIRGVL